MHLVNDHELPVLRFGDGSVVQSVMEGDLPDPCCILPFVSAQVKDQPGIQLRRADPKEDLHKVFGLVQPRFSVNKAAANPRTALVPPSVQKERTQSAYQKRLANMSPEKLAKFREDSKRSANKRHVAIKQGKATVSARTREKKPANDRGRYKTRASMTPEEREKAEKAARERYHRLKGTSRNAKASSRRQTLDDSDGDNSNNGTDDYSSDSNDESDASLQYLT